MSEQTTLILLKPDTVSNNRCGEVLKRFEEAGFAIRGLKMIQLDDGVLQEHYAHIASRPFFPEVVAFMKKTPVVALALSGENVIDRVRALLGPTDSRKADKGTLRGDFGVDSMINVAHASDSPEAAEAELKRFFGTGEVFTRS
jgi:nucleoside-diphosphate kinase